MCCLMSLSLFLNGAGFRICIDIYFLPLKIICWWCTSILPHSHTVSITVGGGHLKDMTTGDLQTEPGNPRLLTHSLACRVLSAHTIPIAKAIWGYNLRVMCLETIWMVYVTQPVRLFKDSGSRVWRLTCHCDYPRQTSNVKFYQSEVVCFSLQSLFALPVGWGGGVH